MIRKLIPVLLALIGLGIGSAAGLFLRPAAEEPAAASPEAAAHGETAAAEPAHAEEETPPEYVKMNNQFVIPVLEGGRVASMVIVSLSLEVATGSSEQVYSREPKLRDAFLQVLFDHANAGGFRGSFTDGSNLILLRKALLEKARSVIGEVVQDVLISDIARQDS
ncbi:MAG: flagellar basal body-associated FliL family protein [Rhodobacteraceae bacterium]|nr:flagellar basal body-associated FliL family protein [Paracoccaceae bacterium]